MWVQVEAIGDPKGHPLRYRPGSPGPGGPGYGRHRRQGHPGLRPAAGGLLLPDRRRWRLSAAAASLKEIMLREHIHGSFALGGITGYLVEMLRAGCFRQLMDVQCFDLDAVASIRDDPRHREISANHYAGPGARGAVVVQSGRGHPGRHGN